MIFNLNRTASVFAKRKDGIISKFTKTADELIALNAEISKFETEQELKIAKANEKIAAAIAEKEQAAATKAQNQAVADRIFAIVS